MKTFLKQEIITLALCFFLTSSIAFAQTGAPPGNGQGPRACLNVFAPGIIINAIEAMLNAPGNVPPLQSNGAIGRINGEADDENEIPVVRVEFDMGVNDNRGDVCFFFEFQGFANGDPDHSRVVRVEQVDVNALFEAGETECQLADDGGVPNASFTLQVYEDGGDESDPLGEEDLITDFSGAETGDADPLLLVTNIPDAPPFDINLTFCDETPEDDPNTEVDESLEPIGFYEVPTLQEYCDAAEEANPDAEAPEICGELIRRPANRQIFVITNTDGYFNYSVDR